MLWIWDFDESDKHIGKDFKIKLGSLALSVSCIYSRNYPTTFKYNHAFGFAQNFWVPPLSIRSQWTNLYPREWRLHKNTEDTSVFLWYIHGHNLFQYVQLRIAGKQSECRSCGTTFALSLYSSRIIMLFWSPYSLVWMYMYYTLITLCGCKSSKTASPTTS